MVLFEIILNFGLIFLGVIRKLKQSKALLRRLFFFVFNFLFHVRIMCKIIINLGEMRKNK